MGCDTAEAASITQELARCLEDNPVWKTQLAAALQDLPLIGKESQISISLLNPSNILLSIYMLHARDDGILYQPGYRIIIGNDENNCQMIFGVVEASGIRPSLSAIVRDYYNSDPGQLLFPLNWGGYERRDARIVRDIGLKYSTYKVVHRQGEAEYWKLTELGWEPCEPFGYLQHFLEYLQSNQEFVTDICEFFSTNWNGFMTTYKRNDDFQFRT